MNDPNGLWADAPTMTLDRKALRGAVRDLQPSIGAFSDITVREGTVFKRDRTLLSEDEALSNVQGLREYANKLQRERVPIAPLLGARYSRFGDGFVVEHEVGLVAGTGLDQMPEGQDAFRRAVVGKIIDVIAGMSTIPGYPDRLRIGIDAAARNWRVDLDTATGRGRPTLVDLYPPLLRDERGSLTLSPNRANRVYYNRLCGTRSGAVAHILVTAYMHLTPVIDQEGGAADFVKHFRDLVPAHMIESVIDAVVERQLGLVSELGKEALAAIDTLANY